MAPGRDVRTAAAPAVAVGRARRSLHSLSRPPLNGCIVGQINRGRMDLSSSVANRLRAAFPSAAAADVDLALAIIEEDRRGPTDHDVGRLVVNGEPLHIPARIYSPDPEPRSIAGLTAPAQTILHCLFSRHHDGRVREAHLREVIPSPCAWAPPYVIQLVGEYVIEIVNVVLENLGYLRQKTYARFVAREPGLHDAHPAASHQLLELLLQDAGLGLARLRCALDFGGPQSLAGDRGRPGER